MNEDQDILADPWLKAGEMIRPADVRLVCTYELNVVVETFVESAYFRRIDGKDELWIDDGCVYAVVAQGDETPACQALLERLFRARLGFHWPEKFLAGGIVDETAYSSLVRRIDDELKENSERARLRETKIIQVARELGLSPQPTGRGPDSWQAWCPQTTYPLYINAAANTFACGWCQRKGSVEELRAFSKERKERCGGRGSAGP